MRQYVIREHGYSFVRCDCGEYLGGDRTQRKVEKLMRIKVRPTVRPA